MAFPSPETPVTLPVLKPIDFQDSSTNPYPKFKQLTLAGSISEPGLKSLQCQTGSHSSASLAQCGTHGSPPAAQKFQATATTASPAPQRPTRNHLKRQWPGKDTSPTKKSHNRPSRISSTNDTQPSTRLPNSSVVGGSKCHFLQDAAVPSDKSTFQDYCHDMEICMSSSEHATSPHPITPHDTPDISLTTGLATERCRSPLFCSSPEPSPISQHPPVTPSNSSQDEKTCRSRVWRFQSTDCLSNMMITDHASPGLAPEMAPPKSQCAPSSVDIQVDQDFCSPVPSCGSPLFSCSAEATPATMSPFEASPEPLAHNSPSSPPNHTRRPTQLLKKIAGRAAATRVPTSSEAKPQPGIKPKPSTRKSSALPSSHPISISQLKFSVKKPPSSPKKLPSNTGPTPQLLPTKAKKRDTIFAESHLPPLQQPRYPDGSWEALTNQLKVQPQVSAMDKENRLPCQPGKMDSKNLPPLDEKWLAAMEAFVPVWPARQVVIAMNQIVLYRLSVLRWGVNSSHQPVSLDDLREALASTHHDRIYQLVTACKRSVTPCDTLRDAILSPAIQATVITYGEGPETTVELRRDFTFLGLVYLKRFFFFVDSPLIKTLRAFWADNHRKATWGEFREWFSRRHNSGLRTCLVPMASRLQEYVQTAEENQIVKIMVPQSVHSKSDPKILDRIVLVTLEPEWWSNLNPFYQPDPSQAHKQPNRPNLLAHKVCFTCSEKGHINKNCPKSSILEVMRKAMDNYQLGKQKKEDIITQMVEAANGNYSFDNKPLMI
ncbi:hypothetical protein VP01_757g8 [Puccinia sorghi]|uniref:CCHC-type domain-containing protein n=1 Tax=Puccinia sorghi TaxID=27349 RepID=A0A0L6UC13_9BASI|nr:hypothetical protein VP01_757g8 [Puccinia sorghi]